MSDGRDAEFRDELARVRGSLLRELGTFIDEAHSRRLREPGHAAALLKAAAKAYRAVAADPTPDMGHEARERQRLEQELASTQETIAALEEDLRLARERRDAKPEAPQVEVRTGLPLCWSVSPSSDGIGLVCNKHLGHGGAHVARDGVSWQNPLPDEPRPEAKRCGCGGDGCKGPGDGERHQCGGPLEACAVPGCMECGVKQPEAAGIVCMLDGTPCERPCVGRTMGHCRAPAPEAPAPGRKRTRLTVSAPHDYARQTASEIGLTENEADLFVGHSIFSLDVEIASNGIPLPQAIDGQPVGNAVEVERLRGELQEAGRDLDLALSARQGVESELASARSAITIHIAERQAAQKREEAWRDLAVNLEALKEASAGDRILEATHRVIDARKVVRDLGFHPITGKALKKDGAA